jgi:hypothetical protein
VDSQGYKTLKRYSFDYTDLYGSEDFSKLYDEDVIDQIRGKVDPADKIYIPRAQLLQECKDKLKHQPELSVWEVGYWSTDAEEDNDSSADDGDDEAADDYYDEEDEAEVDPTEKIEQEKFIKGM